VDSVSGSKVDSLPVTVSSAGMTASGSKTTAPVSVSSSVTAFSTVSPDTTKSPMGVYLSVFA
jgi:hypothetical protein